MNKEDYLKALGEYDTWRDASDAQRKVFLLVHGAEKGLLSAATERYEVGLLWLGYVAGWNACDEW